MNNSHKIDTLLDQIDFIELQIKAIRENSTFPKFQSIEGDDISETFIVAVKNEFDRTVKNIQLENLEKFKEYLEEQKSNIGVKPISIKKLVQVISKWSKVKQHKDAILFHLGDHFSGFIEHNIKFLSIIPETLDRTLLIFKKNQLWINHKQQYEFSREDIKSINKSITSNGFKIINSWNGEGCDSYSVATNIRSDKSLINAIENYNKGDVFSRSPERERKYDIFKGFKAFYEKQI